MKIDGKVKYRNKIKHQQLKYKFEDIKRIRIKTISNVSN